MTEILDKVTTIISEMASKSANNNTFFANGFFYAIIAFACIFIGTILTIKFTDKIFKNLINNKKIDITNAIFARKILKVCIIAVAIFCAVIQIKPLEKVAISLLASSGLIVVVLGFAAQEAMSNVVAGAFISFFKPFSIGDYIRIQDKGIDGIVEDITLRHTVIRTFDNNRMIIPNSVINSSVLKNANFGDDKTCNFLEIGISYESSIDVAKEVITKCVLSHNDYYDNRTEEEKKNGVPALIIRVVELSEFSVNLRALVWSKTAFIGAAMLSDLRHQIKDEFEKKGIKIPYLNTVIMSKQK